MQLKNQMNILVTGPFGNVGQSTVDELLKQNYKVRVFDIPTKRNKKIARKTKFRNNVELFWGDIRNFSDVRNAIAGIDVIVHLAAIIPPLADEHPKLAEQVNVGGTKNIVRAIKETNPKCKLIYTSSISIYGDRRKNPLIKVSDPLKPNVDDEYGKQKLKAEIAVRNSGIDWSVVRLTYITSPEKLKLIPLMFRMPLETKIEILRTQDVGFALSNAVKSPNIWGEVMNLGGGEKCRTTYKEYLQCMFSLFGLGPKIQDAAFCEEPFHCGYLDTSKSAKFLKYQRNSLVDYYNDIKKKAAVKRFFAFFVRPLARSIIFSRSPYWHKKEVHIS
ncbi:MAG: NAD-dependent epimerase/dehydratase family protein [Promethearchaeota archaeon]